jgi:hypothetical protein
MSALTRALAGELSKRIISQKPANGGGSLFFGSRIAEIDH